MSRWSQRLDARSGLIDTIANSVLVLILAVFCYQFYNYGQEDPYNCRALLRDGRWAPEDSNSYRARDFAKWEPSGCRMVEFSRENISTCLSQRKLVFAGDATVRQIYWAAAQKLDPLQAKLDILDVFSANKKTENLVFQADNVTLEFIWDPWLNSSALRTALAQSETLAGFDNADTIDQDERSATLIVAGAPGFWAARHGGDDYLELFIQGIDSLRPYLKVPVDHTVSSLVVPVKKNKATSRTRILLLPVQIPRYLALDPLRAETITPSRIDRMNDYLKALPADEDSHILWAFNEMIKDNLKAYEETGLHVVEAISERRLDIILNTRCDASAIGPAHPMRKTCCMSYDEEPWMQPGLLGLGLLGLPLLRWLHLLIRPLRSILPPADRLKAMRNLLFAAAWCWLTDRTHYFSKIERHFFQLPFIETCVVLGGLSLLSIRKSSNLNAIREASATQSKRAPSNAEDCGFLPREQSDEFKGWMQAMILLSFYYGASETLSVFKIVRVLGSAYIYISAYGHTVYLLKIRDFSLKRMALVIFRLNFLTVLLSYTTAGPMSLYGFPMVVSFWYMVTYFTLRAFANHNHSPLRVIGKVVVSSLIVNNILLTPVVLKLVCSATASVFRIQWNSEDLLARLVLERHIVYFGILTAVFAQQVSLIQSGRIPFTPSHPRAPRPQKQSGGILDPILEAVIFPNKLTEPFKPIVYTFSVMFLMFFSVVTQGMLGTKYWYDAVHPYVAFIPVIAGVILRNAHPRLRNHYLALPAALGKISFETFVLQHHIWLASDGTGMLTTGLFDRLGSHFGDSWFAVPGRSIETVLLSLLFIGLSGQAHRATRILISWIFGSGQPGQHSKMLLGILDIPEKARTSEETQRHLTSEQFSVPPDDADTPSATHGEPIRNGKVERFFEDWRMKMAGLLLMMWIGNVVCY